MRSDIVAEHITNGILILIGSFFISYATGFPFWKVVMVSYGVTLIFDAMKDGV